MNCVLASRLNRLRYSIVLRQVVDDPLPHLDIATDSY